MQWNEILNRLEGDVIKSDVMANSDADFMATHMPFKNLNLILHGHTKGEIFKVDEDEIYESLIKNPENRHQVLIVRGPNGAGKSHLIRWFNSRIISNASDFDLNHEKIIFIRRLGNTLRGAVAQLLKEDVVHDEEIKERMRKFINSVDSQDENHFKSTIYYSFIAEVENDNRSEPFTPAERRDLAAFLNDSRVKDILMQENGPISRFYAQIAKPKEVIFGGEAAFVPDDFKFQRSLKREILNNCSSEARRFLNRLADEEDKIAQYLNHFTGAVINRCSNISQGDTREVFAQLRKQLKKQGKNLTIFIEDFTAFTGIDAELITVLSTEHGGEYKDFCRVNAVVGITDAYYEQFKDNFKDRVTHQIEVGEEAYSSEGALTHMAALYLNAIYCKKETIERWYNSGASIASLPVANIENQLPWESIEIEGKNLTIYPFNSKALIEFFNSLEHKTPRDFLKRVILNQLGAYLRDRAAGEHKRFPQTSAQGPTIKLNKLSHASYIENMNLTELDKKRLRMLLCIWGEGHVSVGEQDGVSTIGGLPEKFFELMGFNSFKGLGSTTEPEIPNEEQIPTPPRPPELTRQEQQYNERIADIEGWYQNKDSLRFSEDNRSRIFDFLATSINWQYEGVAAHLASLRYKSSSLLYIDGQQQEGNRHSAAIYMERTPENRDVLIGLTMHHYNKGWDFSEAPYFQLQLIIWLESVKPTFVKAVKGEEGRDWPIFKWAMVAEFLRLALMGHLQLNDDHNSLRPLLFNKSNLEENKARRVDGKWALAQELIIKYMEEFRINQEFLIQMENTYMGFVNQTGGTVHFFDIHDIEKTLLELHEKEWDLENELPSAQGPEILNLSLKLVGTFLPRAKEVLQEEKNRISKTIEKLQKLMSMEVNSDNLKIMSNFMKDFLSAMNHRGVNYPGILISRVDEVYNKAVLISEQYAMLKQSLDSQLFGSLLCSYSSNPLQQVQEIESTISDIKKLAENKTVEFKNNLIGLESLYDIDEGMVDAAVKELKDLYEKIEGMEEAGKL